MRSAGALILCFGALAATIWLAGMRLIEEFGFEKGSWYLATLEGLAFLSVVVLVVGPRAKSPLIGFLYNVSGVFFGSLLSGRKRIRSYGVWPNSRRADMAHDSPGFPYLSRGKGPKEIWPPAGLCVAGGGHESPADKAGHKK